MKIILSILLALTCLSAKAQFKISAYPNTNQVALPWLFLLANPGVTNWNITMSQLQAFLNTNLVPAQAAHATNSDLATRATGAVNATNLWGALNVSNYDNGTSASGSTFLRGDGTWATPANSQTNYIPTITQTNFISGKLYTNKTGRLQVVYSSCFLVTASVNGAANMLIQEDQTGGNTIVTVSSCAIGTIIGFLADSYIFQVTADIVPNGVYAFTNTSTGSGNSSSLQGGTGFIRNY